MVLVMLRVMYLFTAVANSHSASIRSFFGIVTILAMLFVSGCATSASANDYRDLNRNAYQAKVSPSEQQRRDALMRHYRGWEGVPYKYGGNSKRGVDCSGFVYITLKNALGVEAPRSTELLSRIPNRVSKSNLQVGDVVLFRISYKTLHAGVYVGNGRFMHASKSKGVMISELDNPYWRGVYMNSVRLSSGHA